MILLVGCAIIVGTLVGGAVLYIKLGSLERAIERDCEGSRES